LYWCRTCAFAIGQHTWSPDRCDDPNPFVFLLLVGEVAREVFGCETRGLGEGPDLEEMDLLRAVRFFRVGDTSSGGGELQITALEDLNISHGIFAVWGVRA